MVGHSELKDRSEATTSTADQDQRFSVERWATARGSWTLFPELCKGCGLCIERCPVDVIKWSPELGAYGTNRVTVKAEGCITCKICAYYCPDAAISVAVK
ncbi:MAG TPA: 4Fe-4S ferredoxin [Firmicutes bacterium]|nr:4Fe-4S ferredoxin [Bacillota bacterium]